MYRVVSDNLFFDWENTDLFTLVKSLQNIWNDKGIFRRTHFLVKCRLVDWIIISSVRQYRWRCRSPWRWLEGIKHWIRVRQRPFLLQNVFTANKLPHNSMSSYCSLLDLNSSLNFFLCGGSEPKPLGQHWNRYDPVIRLRPRFLRECFPFKFQ